MPVYDSLLCSCWKCLELWPCSFVVELSGLIHVGIELNNSCCYWLNHLFMRISLLQGCVLKIDLVVGLNHYMNQRWLSNEDLVMFLDNLHIY